MISRLITPAATPVLSLADAKVHARVEAPDEDALVTAYVAAATDFIERYCDIKIMPQTWEDDFDGFLDCIRLRHAPVQSLVSVSYFDTDGAAQVYSGAVLRNDALGAYVEFPSIPSTATRVDAVAVRYVAGGVAPEGIIHAARLLVAGHYDSRSDTVIGASVANLGAVKAILDQYKRYGG